MLRHGMVDHTPYSTHTLQKFKAFLTEKERKAIGLAFHTFDRLVNVAVYLKRTSVPSESSRGRIRIGKHCGEFTQVICSHGI